METEKKRRAARKEARERAVQLMKEGRGNEAKEYFQRCVDITPEMAQDVIRAARDRNVDCIVAPYEADSQLAYLATSGIADFVVTEDSDLTLFGCERVLFKLIDSGDCVLYEKEHLNKVFGLQADLLSFEKFRYMCITAGCDYLANLPGIGLGKAKNFWLKVTNPDLRNVLRKIPAYLKMPQVSVTQDYIERFIRANNTFLYQLVFDPVTRKEKPLTPYAADLREEIESLTYAGSYSPPDTAAQMALGNMNIRSQKQVDNFDPDMTEMNLNASNANTKYGKRAFHRSMWCRDFIEKGPAVTSGSGKSQQPSFAFQLSSSQGEKKASQTRPSQIIRSKGIDKRKAEDLPEDEVEKMLLEEDTEKGSPSRKRTKNDFFKNRKIVGLNGDGQGQGKKVISKYFVKASPTIATNNPTENIVPKGRRDSKEESGAWFSDIEKPISAEGKFIYRPDKDTQPSQVSVLKEVSNSPEKTFESPAQRQRRNPFAKQLKSSPVVDLSALQSQNEENKEEPSQPDNSQKSLEITIPSSQLSMYSMDGESLTFSSQDPVAKSQMSDPASSQSPASSPSTEGARSSVTSPPPSSTAPRLGLSKMSTASSSSQSIARTVMGPAKVSGLRRPGVTSLKTKSGDGKIQTKLSTMFARSVTKAQIGQQHS